MLFVIRLNSIDYFLGSLAYNIWIVSKKIKVRKRYKTCLKLREKDVKKSLTPSREYSSRVLHILRRVKVVRGLKAEFQIQFQHSRGCVIRTAAEEGVLISTSNKDLL